MKKIKLLSIAFLLILSACRKKNEEPAPLPVQVYEYDILYINHKEPDLMRTYTVNFNNKWYSASNTDKKRDLESLTWEISKDFPKVLYFHNARRVYPDKEISYSFIQNLK